MKKLSWLFAAILPVLVLISCEKQIASDTGGRNPEMQAGGPPITWTAALTTTAGSPACVGTAFNISTVLTKSNPGTTLTVNCEHGTLKFWVKIGAGAWQQIGSDLADADGTRTISYTPTAAGNYCFKTTWQGNPNANASENAEGNCTNVVRESNVVCVTVTTCTPVSCDDANPLTLTSIVDNVSSTATTSTITMTFTLKSCKDLTQEIRVQGGATAGGNVGVVIDELDPNMYTYSTDGPGVVTTGYPNELNNNVVFSWLVPSILASTPQHFTVTYTRSLLTGCVTSGQWSAKSVGLTDATTTANFCP